MYQPTIIGNISVVIETILATISVLYQQETLRSRYYLSLQGKRLCVWDDSNFVWNFPSLASTGMHLSWLFGTVLKYFRLQLAK